MPAPHGQAYSPYFPIQVTFVAVHHRDGAANALAPHIPYRRIVLRSPNDAATFTTAFPSDPPPDEENLVVMNRVVSIPHARIEPGTSISTIRITDLGSAYGTAVDYKRLRPEITVIIPSGSRIRLGRNMPLGSVVEMAPLYDVFVEPVFDFVAFEEMQNVAKQRTMEQDATTTPPSSPPTEQLHALSIADQDKKEEQATAGDDAVSTTPPGSPPADLMQRLSLDQ